MQTSIRLARDIIGTQRASCVRVLPMRPSGFPVCLADWLSLHKTMGDAKERVCYRSESEVPPVSSFNSTTPARGQFGWVSTRKESQDRQKKRKLTGLFVSAGEVEYGCVGSSPLPNSIDGAVVMVVDDAQEGKWYNTPDVLPGSTDLEHDSSPMQAW